MKGDTPRNSIKRDYCPKLGRVCLCQVACPLRTPEEVARGESEDRLVILPMSRYVDRPRVVLHDEL